MIAAMHREVASYEALSAATFPLRVPLSFAARMAKADPHDPLLAQVLPKMAERLAAVNFVSDPVNDLQHTTSVGVIHKYRSRVLLIAAGTCAVNCRYCFRREFPYAQASLSASAAGPGGGSPGTPSATARSAVCTTSSNTRVGR